MNFGERKQQQQKTSFFFSFLVARFSVVTGAAALD